MKSGNWRMWVAAGSSLAVITAVSAVGLSACTKDAQSKSHNSASDSEMPEASETPESLTPEPKAELEQVMKQDRGAEKAEPSQAGQPTKGATGAPGNAAPVATGGGTTISKEWYTVSIDAPSVAAGSDGTIVLTLVPKKGWKINQEFPTKLTVVPPAGVSVGKDTLKKGDAQQFTEKKVAFTVPFKASAPGSKKFSGKFKFAVCTDATCDPKTETLAFNVDVK